MESFMSGAMVVEGALPVIPGSTVDDLAGAEWPGSC